MSLVPLSVTKRSDIERILQQRVHPHDDIEGLLMIEIARQYIGKGSYHDCCELIIWQLLARDKALQDLSGVISQRDRRW
jgi:hypothetical protein